MASQSQSVRGPRGAIWGAILGSILMMACAEHHPSPVSAGQDLRLTMLHTTDIHSRLIPYNMTVLAGDKSLGLRQENAPFGGVARMMHVIERERARAPRSIYLDSGDCFQGAPIFNAFRGEVEQRALSLMRPDAVVIGNHEFDEGVRNYSTQLERWGTYPVVAANYLFEPGEPLGDRVKPYEIINADGLRIAILGLANFSSISSISDIGNSLHVIPLETIPVVQNWIDVLEPQVDLILATSHAGLDDDEFIIQNTEGLDAILGGHLHIVLNPPKVVKDLAGRDVILAHSGAFAKFVGKLDVVVRDGEILAHDYKVFPIDSRVPEHPLMVDLIEPYRHQLHTKIDLESVFGYASKVVRRFGFDGGDSPLGNLVAESIRQYARADFGMTNSLGIRTDLNPGAIGLDQLYNVFPFNNYVTTMYLSGADVKALLDYSTLRAAGRGCATQIQVSGIRFTMDCAADPPVATDIFLTDCGDPTLKDKDGCIEIALDETAVYEMATNDYIAQGGSGFTVLKINNTQTVTDVALRDAMLETIIRAERCSNECRRDDGTLELEGCVGYTSCVTALTDFYLPRCQGAAETAPGETVVVKQCAIDLGGGCATTADCYAADNCTDETCSPCATSAQCDDGLACFDGYCRAEGIVCSNRACRRSCTDDTGCPGADLALTNGQALCVGGLCEPRGGEPCEDDTSCINVDDVCSSGGCAPCSTIADCGTGELCVGEVCVRPVATCVERRCRVQCNAAADCLPGEICGDQGLCRPQSCIEPQDLTTACEMEALWRASERCLDMPCPDAGSDGRISRNLPANLEDLPDVDLPDDEPLE